MTTPTADQLRQMVGPLIAAYPGVMAAAERKYLLPAWTLPALASRETNCDLTYALGNKRSPSGGWGAFQLDDGSHTIPRPFPFTVQADLAARQLAGDLAWFRTNLMYGDPMLCALSAYNRGIKGAVDSWTRTGSTDTDTAGGDYGRDVLARIRLLASNPPPPPQGGTVRFDLPILREGQPANPACANIQAILGVPARDGIFGPATKQAVVTFQASRGLNADGIVGADTYSALGYGTRV